MDIFVRIDSIKGESNDARHQDEIEALSWSWGVAQAGSAHVGRGSGAGKATFHDLTFVHRVDLATPELYRACATAKHLDEARITVRRAGEGRQEFLVVTMKDVLVTSVSTSVDAEADSAVEVVTLTFVKVDLEYAPQEADGSLGPAVRFAYDLKKNKAT